MLKKVLWILGITLVVANTLAVVYLYSNQTKAGFIDYNAVYNNCKLKVSLEKDLQRVTEARKSELDSMQLELSFQSQAIQAGRGDQAKLSAFEDAKNRFLTFQEHYEQENARLKETYFNQIRKEINDKAKAFASSRGLDFFFTAMGDGALMYGSAAKDMTKEFQSYLDPH